MIQPPTPRKVTAKGNRCEDVSGTRHRETILWLRLDHLPGFMWQAIRAMGQSVFSPLTRTPIDRIEVIADLGGNGPHSRQQIDATSHRLRMQSCPSNIVEYSAAELAQLFGGLYRARGHQFEMPDLPTCWSRIPWGITSIAGQLLTRTDDQLGSVQLNKFWNRQAVRRSPLRHRRPASPTWISCGHADFTGAYPSTRRHSLSPTGRGELLTRFDAKSPRRWDRSLPPENSHSLDFQARGSRTNFMAIPQMSGIGPSTPGKVPVINHTSRKTSRRFSLMSP